MWAGDISLKDGLALADVKDSSTTAGAELKRIGYSGPLEASSTTNPLAAHFELHIGEPKNS